MSRRTCTAPLSGIRYIGPSARSPPMADIAQQCDLVRQADRQGTLCQAALRGTSLPHTV